MNDFIDFTGEETEVEFLEKCLEQWELTTKKGYDDTTKLIQIASVFHEIRHRIRALLEVEE